MDLVTHLDTNDPLVWERLHQSQQAFMAKGFTPDHAMRSGLQLMEHAVNKQATLLSYMDVYFTIGFLFLACAPIVLMLKAGKKNAITDAH